MDREQEQRAAAQLEAAARWLGSDDGLAAARAALRRARLPASGGAGTGLVAEHDLTTDAFLRFRDRVVRHGPLDELQVPAYLTRVLQHLVTDVLRARPPFPVDPLDDDVDATAAGLDVVDESVGRTDALRAAIESADAARWERAAALAYVTVAAHPDAVPADHEAPRAKQGASAREQAMWHALWFTGRREGLFAVNGNEPSAAIRKARSRAGAAVRAVVERSARVVYREFGDG